MITNKQLDRICDLLVDYRKAIVELTTAAPEERMAAAYEFAAIDQMVHEMLASWVEQEDTKTEDDGWVEWGGGEDIGHDGNVRVQVRYSNGREYQDRAKRFFWGRNGKDAYIEAYRVVG